jgi:uncharacterized protein YbjQ (UPF0145 family)
MALMTGLSGNELWCLSKKGFHPGHLVVGNSVYSMGLIGGIGSGIRSFLGGEVTQITQLVHDGRMQSYQRLLAEVQSKGACGVTGLSNEVLFVGTNIEFTSIGSTLQRSVTEDDVFEFTSASDGQELYAQIDAGFVPKKFVFGNVAYSVGMGGNIMGALRSVGRGELKEFSEVFNRTRHLALERIVAEAREAGANSVVGIKTTIVPFQGVQEMLMLGTASYHPGLPASATDKPVTSDLTCQEMWNLASMGYAPVEVVLGVSVYSMGWIGRAKTWLSSFVRGELTDYTRLIYDARENAIAKLGEGAAAAGADQVAGVKTYVYDLGQGLIEFIAIGTAIKRIEGFKPQSEQLPAQAVIKDVDTFINTVDVNSATLNQGTKKSAGSDKKVVTGWAVIRVLLRLLGG